MKFVVLIPTGTATCGCSTPEIKCDIVPNFNISKVRFRNFAVLNYTMNILGFYGFVQNTQKWAFWN